jgi:hypothetical protein
MNRRERRERREKSTAYSAIKILACVLHIAVVMKIPVPKQHGAWGMLYIPYLSAVFCFSTFDGRSILALVLITAGFFLQEPLLTLVRLYPVRKSSPERFSFLLRWAAIYAAVASIVFVYLLLLRPLLLAFGAAIVLSFLIHVRFLAERSDRDIVGEFASIISLTITAPLTWYILSGSIETFGFLLWILNILYFGSSIFYVKTRVARVAKKKLRSHVMRDSVIYHSATLLILLLAVSIRIIPWIAMIAFLPVLIRAFWAVYDRHAKLNLRRIGLAEIGFSIFFLLLISFGLH